MHNQTRKPKTMHTLLLIGLAIILAANLALPQPVSANPSAFTLFATPGGKTSGACNSWADACTLQYALTVAASGDQIWVKAGVHKPGLNSTDTYALKDGVALYGGFTGTETLLSQHDPALNITVLSGDIDGDDFERRLRIQSAVQHGFRDSIGVLHDLQMTV